MGGVENGVGGTKRCWVWFECMVSLRLAICMGRPVAQRPSENRVAKVRKWGGWSQTVWVGLDWK